MLHEEREKATTGTHVFLFRPEYAREAYERYGIPIEPQHGGMQELHGRPVPAECHEQRFAVHLVPAREVPVGGGAGGMCGVRGGPVL